MTMNNNTNDFLHDFQKEIKIASDVEIGDHIILSNGNIFYVDDIDTELIDDIVAEIYGDFDDASPLHLKYTFFNIHPEYRSDENFLPPGLKKLDDGDYIGPLEHDDLVCVVRF